MISSSESGSSDSLMRNALVKLFLLFLFLSAGQSTVFAAVVINEIYPKYSDPAWEWVELYNTGSESVLLDRWKLDHTAGDAESYILNASATIQPHGFLTLFGSQTSINFSIEGDTVRLFDANGTLADSKSYPGTLGYNTAMGRSTDGGDSWVICAPNPHAATPNKPNNCPIPTSTPTPIPTQPPSNTPTPTFSPASGDISPASTPTPTSLFREAGGPAQSQVLGVMNDPDPPANGSRVRRWLGIGSLGIAGLALLALIIRFYRVLV